MILVVVAGVDHSFGVGVVGGDGLSPHHHRDHRHHSHQEDHLLPLLPFLGLLFLFFLRLYLTRGEFVDSCVTSGSCSFSPFSSSFRFFVVASIVLSFLRFYFIFSFIPSSPFFSSTDCIALSFRLRFLYTITRCSFSSISSVFSCPLFRICFFISSTLRSPFCSFLTATIVLSLLPRFLYSITWSSFSSISSGSNALFCLLPPLVLLSSTYLSSPPLSQGVEVAEVGAGGGWKEQMGVARSKPSSEVG